MNTLSGVLEFGGHNQDAHIFHLDPNHSYCQHNSSALRFDFQHSPAALPWPRPYGGLPPYRVACSLSGSFTLDSHASRLVPCGPFSLEIFSRRSGVSVSFSWMANFDRNPLSDMDLDLPRLQPHIHNNLGFVRFDGNTDQIQYIHDRELPVPLDYTGEIIADSSHPAYSSLKEACATSPDYQLGTSIQHNIYIARAQPVQDAVPTSGHETTTVKYINIYQDSFLYIISWPDR